MAYPPIIPVIIKDPSADLDYGLDLSPSPVSLKTPYLSPGDYVTALTVTADAGLTVGSSSITANASGVPASQIVAWLSGGVIGTTYNVRFLFTTFQGRTDTRSIQVCVVQR